MKGEGTLPVDWRTPAAGCIAADIVYVPLLTSFLASARAAGLVTVDGLGMLLHQAVPGFARWFGVRPEVTSELRARLVADIEGT
jgi:shikimate dehydrogenase